MLKSTDLNSTLNSNMFVSQNIAECLPRLVFVLIGTMPGLPSTQQDT